MCMHSFYRGLTTACPDYPLDSHASVLVPPSPGSIKYILHTKVATPPLQIVD